jgi:hypothetical protein
MGKIIDLAGKTFGRLKVISYSITDANGHSRWKCICSCGKEIFLRGYSLTNGDTKSCGCLQTEQRSKNGKNNYGKTVLDLVGKVFGRLTVIERCENRGSTRSAYWLCECSCGNTVKVRSSLLISGHTKSCSCIQKETASKLGGWNFKDLTGNKYGQLTVTSFNGMVKRNSTWNCACSCGNTYIAKVGDLQSGNTKSCGCLSESYIASQSKLHFVNYHDALTEHKTVYCKATTQWYKCDIYIPQYNAYIEVHGEQHYKLNRWHKLQATRNGTTPEQEFQSQKYRDKVKKAYAKRHGIYIEVNLMKIKTVEEAIAYIEERLPN